MFPEVLLAVLSTVQSLLLRLHVEVPLTSFSGSTGVALVLLTILSRHATIVAQETGSAPTPLVNPVRGTASAQVPSTGEDASSTAEEDWVAFAKTLPLFGTDSMVGEVMLFDVKGGTLLRWLRR